MQPLKLWMLKGDGRLTRLAAADPKRPMLTPEQIVVPEFDPDPAVDEFRERVYTRYPVHSPDGLLGFVYAEREPTGDELARVAAGG